MILSKCTDCWRPSRLTTNIMIDLLIGVNVEMRKHKDPKNYEPGV